MCLDAGVLLKYLPPYSPNFNPIEQSFAQLKARRYCHHVFVIEDQSRFLSRYAGGPLRSEGPRMFWSRCHIVDTAHTRNPPYQ